MSTVENTIIADEPFSDTLLNARTFGWGTAFPSTWSVGGFFIRTDLKIIYQNDPITGTVLTPVWLDRTSLVTHQHGTAGDGGPLDAFLTKVDLGGTEFRLIDLAVI